MRTWCSTYGALLALAALLTGLVSGAPARGATPAEAYEAGNRAWFDGKYRIAEARWREALELAGPDAALLYNLGNAAFEQEKLGRARYYFQQAAALGAGEVAARAQANLATTQQALAAKYKAKIEKGIVRYDESHGAWHALFTVVGKNLSFVLFLVFALPLFVALFLWTFTARPRLAVASRIVFLSLLVPALVFGTLYFGRVGVEAATPLGIVVADDAEIHDAPDPAAPSRPLPEGLEVEVKLHNEAGFYKIGLSDGTAGYVEDAAVWPLEVTSNE